MGKRTIIPFGPQHPVLPEPVHLDLVVEDETVIEANPFNRIYSQRSGKAGGKKGIYRNGICN